MDRKRVTSAQLALIARRQAQVAQAPRAGTTDTGHNEAPPRLAVSGGFRAGKRKRGNSLIKKAPKDQAHAITYDVRDEYGTLVTRVRTLTYKRPQ